MQALLQVRFLKNYLQEFIFTKASLCFEYSETILFPCEIRENYENL
ncbi:hypothetical protein HMPREF1870_00654 [Bacteroidales bacterium KA00344]|nr:hypothetical protein HMPREF1870_00654 [Bacteroidales bacterium KA00344]